MSANPIADRRSLVKVATHVDSMLTGTINRFAERIRTLSNEITQIEDLSLMSEQQERNNALSATHAHLVTKKQHLQQVKKDASLGWLTAPIQIFNKSKDLRQAEADHAEATQKFESPDEYQERTARINRHNRFVVTERDRLVGLKKELKMLSTASVVLADFQKDAADAIVAAQENGWVASAFSGNFLAMAQHLEASKITEATESLLKLKFQRMPSTQTYEKWSKEAASILDQTYKGYAGFAASCAYSEITTGSIALAKPVLHAKSRAALNNHSHPADQWQFLAATLTNPRSLKTDVLWTIYWSMFQTSQWVARNLDEADAHEDVFTGKVIAQMDRWLSNWGSKHVQQFGYPVERSYIGTFDIAGKPEETRLGADLGMIFDIDIGGLVCRKVALFQAKKVTDGLVNIGSTSSQLSLLSARPRTGFYLFYHQSSHPLHPPAPTVCSAKQIAQCVADEGHDIDAEYLPINVRALGWDWANFLTFGICNAETEFGESFVSVDDAISILGNGDARHLPKHLFVVAITDETRVLELREKIREQYHESVKLMEKEKKTEKSRLANDRDHGMHR